MERVGALGDIGELRLRGAGGEVVEEALAAAEEDRHLVDEELVEKARGDRLLQGRGAAADRDVLVVGRLLGFGHRHLDSLGDEVEAVAAFDLERVTGVVGEDEDRAVVRRVVTPPALPVLVGPGTAHRAEHVAAHHHRADLLPRRPQDIVADAGLAVVAHAVPPLKVAS